MANTAYLFASQGSGFSLAQTIYGSPSGSGFLPAKGVYEWNGLWELRYSTPTATINGSISGANSGPGNTGTVTSGPPGTTLGGYNSGNIQYLWSYVSGDIIISCSNTAAANPTFSKTSVTQGSPVSAVWNLAITDLQTGATYNAGNTTITLTWTNSFVGFTQPYYSGSGNTTIPTGASNLTIKVVAGGGSGGAGFNGVDPGGGGGGGSGGYNTLSIAIAPSDWSGSISYSVGPGGTGISGTGSSTNGSVAAGSVLCGASGGAVGQNGSGGGGNGGAAGAPGGNSGASGFAGHGGPGGSGGAAPLGDGYGKGGDGGSASSTPSPSPGVGGEVLFIWT